jgi:hypothetical protein
MRAVALAAVMFAGTTFAVTAARADAADDDLAVFEDVCAAIMPDIEQVKARAKTEGWAEATGPAYQLPEGDSIERPSHTWTLKKNDTAYIVRVGGGQSTVRDAESGATHQITLTSCSVDLPRATFDTFSARLTAKYGQGKPHVLLRPPVETAFVGSKWNTKVGGERMQLTLYKRPPGQQLGARLEISYFTFPERKR